MYWLTKLISSSLKVKLKLNFNSRSINNIWADSAQNKKYIDLFFVYQFLLLIFFRIGPNNINKNYSNRRWIQDLYFLFDFNWSWSCKFVRNTYFISNKIILVPNLYNNHNTWRKWHFNMRYDVLLWIWIMFTCCSYILVEIPDPTIKNWKQHARMIAFHNQMS